MPTVQTYVHENRILICGFEFTSFRWEKDKEGLERNILVAVDDRPRTTQLFVGNSGPTHSSKLPSEAKPEPIKSETNDHLASMHLDSDDDVVLQLNPKGTVEELFAARTSFFYRYHWAY